MEMSWAGWIVTAVAILLTGVSKSGLGGALGGLAVPLMSVFMSPREALAVMLPILIAIDLFGIRAWRGKASWPDLRLLLPAALLGITVGTLLFGFLSERFVKGLVGLIAVGFGVQRLVGKAGPRLANPALKLRLACLCGAGAGFTSALAHAGGPPALIYLLSRGLSRDTFVATTVFLFTAINLAKLPFYIGLNLFDRATLLMSATLMPLVPMGVWMGMRILRHIPERPFFLLATAGLSLSGVKLLWDALSG
jgi:uncharacterized membrane protein YfcA